MKKYIKLLFVFTLLFYTTSCKLHEDPPFLLESDVFSNVDYSKTALNGAYKALAAYNNYGMTAQVLFNGFSGLFTQRMSGAQLFDPINQNLYSLKPQSNSKEVENVWLDTYKAIGRANDIIANLKEIQNPVSSDDRTLNDILGEAYFIRAFEYFNLVQLWGEVPLRLEPMTTKNVHMPVSPVADIYEQIISDAQKAAHLVFPKRTQSRGYPGAEAAHMLLAKIYMTLAGNKTAAETEYWQLAYDEAIQVYGKYQLVDFAKLWSDEDGDNCAENIFELQYNLTNASSSMKLYTPNGATKANTWGRFFINVDVFDEHVATYGDPNYLNHPDKRINQTYRSMWINVQKVPLRTQKCYPLIARKNFMTSYPVTYKYWSKNVNIITDINEKNFILYRYADLLLMLAEISNELQNGEETGYVTEVLTRAGVAPQPQYGEGQDGFREAIMKEYIFELIGEGHDPFYNRRRGFDWFKSHVIDKHNNYEKWNPKLDTKLAEDEETAMHIPIPSTEINTNQDIN